MRYFLLSGGIGTMKKGCMLLFFIAISLQGMENENLFSYKALIVQQAKRLADIQPPLTTHQIIKLIQECDAHPSDDRSNLVNACQSNDIQAVDQTLRNLINDRFRNNVHIHRNCKENFCIRDASEKYCNQVYSDESLKEIHHFNKHQFSVMLAHLHDNTDDAKTLFHFIICLYKNTCTNLEKQQMAQLTQILVKKHKNEMQEHQHCTGKEFCFGTKE